MAEVDDVYNSRDEMERLGAILEQRYLAMLNAVHAAMIRVFGLDPTRYTITDADVNRILVDAARQVVRIDETTRQAIAEQLRVGQALGLSTWEIANGNAAIGFHGIEGLYQETWKGRAEMIARTELQHAQNEASLNRYAATGMVDMVRIIDGDQWDEPCAIRNGTVVPISSRPQLNHPHCTLTLVPVIREGTI